jgi:hypothetical protein
MPTPERMIFQCSEWTAALDVVEESPSNIDVDKNTRVEDGRDLWFGKDQVAENEHEESWRETEGDGRETVVELQ